MAAHQVRVLLMGGQACVFYGAAEFSRDIDLAILAGAENWQRLQAALTELQACGIAVPPCEMQYLLRGFALHFRCGHPDAAGLRIDVMSVMRGVEEFPKLWERRTSLADSDGVVYDLLSLPDLVKAKKTQRSKDWPMIRRLMEADYLAGRDRPEPERLRFWLRELRSPEFIIATAQRNPKEAEGISADRPLLRDAISGNSGAVAFALEEEERREREQDRLYWQPLKAELERLRHGSPGR